MDETQERQVNMIVDELLKGRKRHEIIDLYSFDPSIFDTLEQFEGVQKRFKKAEIQSFLSDVDYLRSNLNTKTFNAAATAMYFYNRHGWSIRPNKVPRGLNILSHEDVVEKALAGELDCEVALALLKAAALNAEIKFSKLEKTEVNNSLQVIQKYIEEKKLG